MCRVVAAATVFASLAVAGCGGSNAPKAPPGVSQSAYERQLADAQRVSATDLPAPHGKTLQQLADGAKGGQQVGLGSSVFVPGINRLAFGVIDANSGFVYGKTAVYMSRSPDKKAVGPFLAPADSLLTEGRYRSKQAALDSSPIASIYATQVPLSRAGHYAVLVLTKVGGKLLGARTEITVQRRTPIPSVGQRPPAISTDTLAAAGSEKAIDTRLPPAPQLHETDLKDVVGKKPVALLFATPQLCQSRVCGPVVDIELQMQSEFGDRMAFIHQEVYKDNQVQKGLRAQLLAYHLQTEPWLFTFDKTGRVAARLEGSFGTRAFRAAIEAALR